MSHTPHPQDDHALAGPHVDTRLDAALQAVLDIAARTQPLAPVAIDTLTLPQGLSVLVLAPHPDDFDAIGVTLRHFQQHGARIHLAVCTTGASGVEDGYANAHSDADKGALRETEQAASCAFFGLPDTQFEFLRLPSDEKGNPRLDETNHATVRRLIEQHRPHCMFLPHGNDSNVTHQRTCALLENVMQQNAFPVWAWLNQDAKTIAMRQDVITPFDETTAQWKAELLRFHASQHQRNLNTRGHGFDDRVLRINQKAAAAVSASMAYAEVFELKRLG